MFFAETFDQRLILSGVLRRKKSEQAGESVAEIVH